MKDTAVHHHANFALYVNGQQDKFESFTYYEEVAACTDPTASNPKVRVHMHENKAGLIHVHDGGVTWGQFFENIGYTLGDEVIATNKEVFTNVENGSQLSFILNGKPANNIANKTIESEDRLLINYGQDTQDVLTDRFSSVDNTAAEANRTHDPSSCAGAHKTSVWERLQRAIGINAISSIKSDPNHSH